MARRSSVQIAARILAELGIVFVGVLAALAADDWREWRSELAEARESLAVIEADLRRDSTYLANLVAFMRPRNEAAEWLLARWGREGVDRDSVARHLQLVMSGPPTIRLNRAGFDGLIAGNGLRLVDDPSLRAALLDYYQGAQPLFEDFVRRSIELRLEARRNLAEYARFILFEGGGLELTSSWARIRQDGRLRHDLTFSAGAMLVATEERMPDLRDRISSLLGMLRSYGG